MDDYRKANRAYWNELTPIHARSEFYDVEGFKAGKSTLMPLEREELGEVAGKSLLHLQCHFGLDTLSWARLGARVTGVDFSGEAIALARSLSRELDIPATFVCSDLYELPAALSGQFDVVFTSYGVLCWLPDLRRWAEIAASYVKPGGVFYIVEFHPFSYVFDDSRDATDLRVAYSYFRGPEPDRWEPAGTYAEPGAQVTHPSYEWTHSLGDILSSLVAAGLRIEHLHEFPYTCYQALPLLERCPDGWWRLKGGRELIPLIFSLKARR